MRRLALAALGVAIPAVLPSAAQAHIVGARLGDFYAGALHPLTDPQDVLLWLALGVLAGSLGAARGRLVVLVFPLGLVAGLALGAGARVPPVFVLGDATATVAMGLLLATAIRLPASVLCAIAASVGVMRGAVNAGGMAPQTSTILFAAGLGAAGYVVVTLVAAVSAAFGSPARGSGASWRPIAIRACGSWIAAIGLMMGGLAFRT